MLVQRSPSRAELWATVAATVVLTEIVGAVGLAAVSSQGVGRIGVGLLPVLVLVGAGVGALATSRPDRWRGWYVVPLVAVLGLGLHQLTEALRPGAGDSSPSAAASPSVSVSSSASSSAGVGTPAHRLTTPGAFAAWHADTSHAAMVVVRSSLSRLPAVTGLAPVAQVYQRSTGEQVLFLGYNTARGSAARRQLVRPGRALSQFLSGAGVTRRHDADPGPLGGRLACGRPATAQVTVCTWVDTRSTGTVDFVGHPVTVDRAARLARELRAGVTRAAQGSG